MRWDLVVQTQSTVSSGEAKPVRTRVFLSYSRKDAHFTRRLADALAARPEGYAPDYDQSSRDPANIDSGISAEDEWWQRLQQMIAAADVMVFIVSPDSAASKVCDEEIAYARNLGKRIIPVLRRPIDFAKAPPRLSALNMKLNFFEEDEASFATALDQLCAVLDLDVAWHRESRRLTELALKWEAEGRPTDRVMSPADIRGAERLLEQRPKNAEPPSQVLSDFLHASRVRLEEEMRRLRRTIGRAFVKPAEVALGNGQQEHALRLAAAGALLAEDLDFALVPQLWPVALMAISTCRTLAVLSGHGGGVPAASVSPNGQQIVTASYDCTARVWDFETGGQVLQLKGHDAPLVAANFNHDGSEIVTASDDGVIRVWNSSGDELALLKTEKEAVGKIVLSADCGRIAIGHIDGTISVWNINARQMTARIADLQTISSLFGTSPIAGFSPTGTFIATESKNNTIRISSSDTGQEITTLNGHTGRINSVSFSADGRFVLTASEDETGRIWSLENGLEKLVLRPDNGGVAFAMFARDGRRVICGSHIGPTTIWDTKSGERLSAIGGSAYAASSSDDGRRVVTLSPVFSGVSGRDMKQSTAMKLWDGDAGALIAVLNGHEGFIFSACFSPDSRKIVTTSVDGTARVWEANAGIEIARAISDTGRRMLYNAAFDPTGRKIHTESRFGKARTWDAETGKELSPNNPKSEDRVRAWFSPDGSRILIAPRHGPPRILDMKSGAEVSKLDELGDDINYVCFNPNAHRLITSSYRSARIWDVASGAQVTQLAGLERGLHYAAFDPTGGRIVTASGDHIGRVWSEDTGVQILRLAGHEGQLNKAEFSPNGRKIVTASDDGTARLWDATSGEEAATLRAHSQDDDSPEFQIRVRDASFSADGRLVVTACHDGSARVWDANEGSEISVLTGHTDHVYTASFSPDGQRIVTASRDSTARVWDAVDGCELGPVMRHRDRVRSARFSPDGRRIVTSSWDGTARIWDVSRTVPIVKDRALVLTAALARGVGLLTVSDRDDLLLGQARDDLYGEAMRQLGGRAGTVESLRLALHAPLHPNCYTGPKLNGRN